MLAMLLTISLALMLQPASGPEVFAPGSFAPGSVFRGTFTRSGDAFYFFLKTGEGETYRIHVSDRTATGWTTPRVVDLGGPFSDLYPAISADGRRLVFSSYRPVPGETGAATRAQLWYADRTSRGWGPPVFLANLNQAGHYHSWVEYGFDGALYFRRTTPDWRTTTTMRAPASGVGFGLAAPYADVERWKGWRDDVRIAGGSPGPDGLLVFLDVPTTNPRTGRGASDIWVSLRTGNNRWSDPVPLGAGVNADGYDVFPFVSPDGKDLYFVRDFSTFHRVPMAAVLASIAAGPQVRYVANSGMLITTSGRRFLVDAPIRDGIAPYATSSADERTRLERAQAPYDDVDAILITHWHEDHFSAEAVAAYLANSPRTLLISSPEVVDRVRAVAPALPDARYRPTLPAPGERLAVAVRGLDVHVLRIHHNPTRRLPEQHVGFLIGSEAAVLHVGDADPKADNFGALRSLPPIDLACLPFWYVTDAANRRMVAEAIRPRRVVAMHVPPGDAAEVTAAAGQAGADTVVATRLGELLVLPR